MTTIEIPETVEPIIAWVREKKPDAVVGQCRSPNACIIAEYLQEKYPAYWHNVIPSSDGEGQVNVITKVPTVEADGRLSRHVEIVLLPHPLNTLANVFDEVIPNDDPRLEEGGEATMITAGEFLAKWEEIERERQSYHP